MPSNMPRTVLSLNGNRDECEFSYMRLGWLQNGYNLLNRICYSPNDNKGNCFKYASLIRLVIKRCRVQKQSLIGLCETVSHWATYKSDCETCKKETVYSKYSFLYMSSKAWYNQRDFRITPIRTLYLYLKLKTLWVFLIIIWKVHNTYN